MLVLKLSQLPQNVTQLKHRVSLTSLKVNYPRQRIKIISIVIYTQNIHKAHNPKPAEYHGLSLGVPELWSPTSPAQAPGALAIPSCTARVRAGSF